MLIQDLNMTDAEYESSNPQAISILFVDDDQDLLTLGKLFLERIEEFRVDTMTSAEEALNLSQIQSYDVIVSDYRLPGMDGIAFLKTFREKFGYIPFILFTGRGTEEVVIEAINNGADFYQRKGGDLNAQYGELVQKIKLAVRRKQVERSFHDSKKQLEDIINFLPDATFAIDRSGRLIAWNRAIEEMTGIPSGDMLGKGDYEYAIPFYGFRRSILIDLINEPDEKISEFYSNVYRTGPSITAETDLPHPKGTRIGTLIKVSPLYNQAGEITGAIESIRDITERKLAEEALQKSHEILKGILESPKNLVIFALDQQYRYIAFNENHRKTMKLIWGVEISLGISMLEYIRTPEDRKKAMINFDRALSGESFTVSEIYGDTALERRWYEDNYNPIRSENGSVIGLTLILSDITDRKQMEEALQKQKALNDAVLESVPGLLYVSDEDGYLVQWNKNMEIITGYSPEELAGMHMFDWIRDDLQGNVLTKTVIERTKREGSSTSEVYLTMKDGSTIPFYFTAVRLDTPEKTYITGIAIDISSRKKAEDALRMANRQLKLLSHITRHDILNKISVILGYLTLIEADCNDPTIFEYFRNIKTTTTTIKSQIEFTRVYKDLGTHEPQWLHLSMIMPHSQVPDTITLTSDVLNIFILADPMLEKVFSNLLDNSIRHGQRVTEIRVYAYESGNDLIVIWEDNGVGIAKEDKENIFERGFGKNTGLGLFLVREVLSLTGISIRETGNEGSGARFEILVPRPAFRRKISQ